MQGYFNTLHLILEQLFALFDLYFIFFSNQNEQVRVNLSECKVISTGAPQGCVLTPLSFHTNDR